MQIRSIDIDKVKVKPGRTPHSDVAAMVSSIKEVGMLEPIVVLLTNDLVAGLTRLLACKSLGYTVISAVNFEGTADAAELATIDENLQRGQLTALERATLVAQRKTVYEKLHPETKAGVAGGVARAAKAAGDERARESAFAANTAKATGTSLRAVQEDAQIGAKIAPDVKEDIKGTPLADKKSELVKLSRETPEAQKEIAAKVKAGAKSVREAKGKKPAGGPAETFDSLYTVAKLLLKRLTFHGIHSAANEFDDAAVEKCIRAAEKAGVIDDLAGMAANWKTAGSGLLKAGNIARNVMGDPAVSERQAKLAAERGAKSVKKSAEKKAKAPRAKKPAKAGKGKK